MRAGSVGTLPVSPLEVRCSPGHPGTDPRGARGSGRGAAGPLHHSARPQLRSSTSSRLRPPILSARSIATLPPSSPTGQRREGGSPAPGQHSLCESIPSATRRGRAPLQGRPRLRTLENRLPFPAQSLRSLGRPPPKTCLKTHSVSTQVL